jgi:hypothetical protein
MDYWREHAEIAASEAGLTGLTENQLEAIADVIESAHEFYGQSMGHDVASVNFRAEEQRQQAAAIKAIGEERDAISARADRMLKDVRRERDLAKFEAQEARRKLAELQMRAQP